MSQSFIREFNAMQEAVHATAKEKGWWDKRERLEMATVDSGNGALEAFARIANQLSCLMLVTTEIAEAAEGIRNGNPPDDKIPNFSSAEAECADAIIRLMDLAEREGWDLAGAIVEKAQMNKGREYMHGGKKA